MKIIDSIDLLPDDEDANSIRQWRIRVAQVACSVWLFTFLLLVPFLVMALFTGLPRIGSVVFASELGNKIDAAVENAVAPIRRDVVFVRQAVDELIEGNKKAAAAALGNVIINATRERCRAVAQGRNADAWTDRMIELRRQYKDLTNENFMPLTCADV
jgi:hypothetical protein